VVVKRTLGLEPTTACELAFSQGDDLLGIRNEPLGGFIVPVAILVSQHKVAFSIGEDESEMRGGERARPALFFIPTT
jgi:hypothetical protein